MAHFNYLSRKTLEELVSNMPDESAHSTLVVFHKMLHIVSTSRDYSATLEFRVKERPSNVRVYSYKVRIHVRGRQPRTEWDDNTEYTQYSRQSLASLLINQWATFSSHVSGTGGADALETIIEGYRVISETLTDCLKCTGLRIPVENLRVKHEATEFLSMN